MIDFVMLLAQSTTKPATAPEPGLFNSPLILLVAMGLIMYFIMIRPQGAEKKRRQSMLDAIKKNDRVVTIGGIIGTVLNVKDDEITLKVDESSNTKITFSRTAIQKVLGTESVDPTPSTATKK